jgi:hypothetical protein
LAKIRWHNYLRDGALGEFRLAITSAWWLELIDSNAVGDEWLRACSIITGESLARHEVRTVFRRREAEGILRSGQAATLYSELNADIVAGDITIQREIDLLHCLEAELTMPHQ